MKAEIKPEDRRELVQKIDDDKVQINEKDGVLEFKHGEKALFDRLKEKQEEVVAFVENVLGKKITKMGLLDINPIKICEIESRIGILAEKARKEDKDQEERSVIRKAMVLQKNRIIDASGVKRCIIVDDSTGCVNLQSSEPIYLRVRALADNSHGNTRKGLKIFSPQICDFVINITVEIERNSEGESEGLIFGLCMEELICIEELKHQNPEEKAIDIILRKPYLVGLLGLFGRTILVVFETAKEFDIFSKKTSSFILFASGVNYMLFEAFKIPPLKQTYYKLGPVFNSEKIFTIPSTTLKLDYLIGFANLSGVHTSYGTITPFAKLVPVVRSYTNYTKNQDVYKDLTITSVLKDENKEELMILANSPAISLEDIQKKGLSEQQIYLSLSLMSDLKRSRKIIDTLKKKGLAFLEFLDIIPKEFYEIDEEMVIWSDEYSLEAWIDLYQSNKSKFNKDELKDMFGEDFDKKLAPLTDLGYVKDLDDYCLFNSRKKQWVSSGE